MISFQIRVVTMADDGQQQVHEIMSLERTELKPETLGLTLAEGKAILREIQRVVVEHRLLNAWWHTGSVPPAGSRGSSKGHHDLPLRTVFGKITIPSPRLLHCDCQPHDTKSFSPLAQVAARAHDAGVAVSGDQMVLFDELWSDGRTLQEVLPMDSPLHASTIREHVFNVAQRLEEELGEEQWSFIEGGQRDWNKLPPPDGPLTVGIDGGYVRGRNKAGPLRSDRRQKPASVSAGSRRRERAFQQMLRFCTDL